MNPTRTWPCSVKQAHEWLRVHVPATRWSLKQVYAWLAAGRLPGVKVGVRTWMVGDLDAWKANLLAQASTSTTPTRLQLSSPTTKHKVLTHRRFGQPRSA